MYYHPHQSDCLSGLKIRKYCNDHCDMATTHLVKSVIKSDDTDVS